MGSELNQGSRAGKPYILEVVLDRKSSQPLHAQISKPLEKLILSGELEASALIEDEVSMAKRLSVSRPTTRRALQDLVAKGLLSRQRGIGTHVTPRQVHRPMGLTSLKSDLERLGFKTETEVLSYEVFLAGPEEEQMFRCDKGTELVRVKRLRKADGEPIALLTNVLLADLAPSFTQLSKEGLYDCLESSGVLFGTANHRVRARDSDEKEAELMEIEEGSAVLTMTQTVFDILGKTVEFGSHIYDPALYQLSFISTAE